MRFATTDQEAPPAAVLVRHGERPTRPDGYRWFATWLGGDRPAAIGFDHEALELHGQFSLSLPDGRLAVWGLRLWRPVGMVTIACCLVEIDQLPEPLRPRAVQGVINRLDRLGKSMPVVLFGGLTTEAADQLVDSGRLCRVAPGEDRILVAPGITVTKHDHLHGAVELEIRHRRQLIKERRWSRPGDEVVRRRWWYRPERSAPVQCESHAAAVHRLQQDSMYGGAITLDYLLERPDGSRIEASTQANESNAMLRPGDRVRSCLYLVKESTRSTGFESADKAVRNAWAWDAEEIVEELVLGDEIGDAVTVPGERVRIRADWT